MRRLLFILACLLPGLLSAQDLLGEFGPKTKVQLLVEPATAKPGETIDVALKLTMAKGWHTYWRNPGENGTATSVKWTLPTGITAGDIRWPVPEKVEWFEMFTYAYHGEVWLLVPMTLAGDLKPGEYSLKGKVDWLECEETCIPGSAMVEAKLVVGSETKPGQHTATFQKWRQRLPRENQAGGITAQWAGLGEEGRMLTIKVRVKDASKPVVFFPYLAARKDFVVQGKAALVKEEGFVRLTHEVKSKTGKWPDMVAGVLLADGKGQKVQLPVAKPGQSAETGLLEPDSSLNPLGAIGSIGLEELSKVELVLDATKAAPGGKVMAGVRFRVREGWHIYHKDPGGPGLPPSFEWELPNGVSAGEVLWPKPEVFQFDGEDNNGYHGEVMLLVPLTIAEDVAQGPMDLRVKVEWQECKDVCVLGEASLQAELAVADAREASSDEPEIAKWRKQVEEARGPPELGAKTKVTLLLAAEQAKAGDMVLAGVRFEIPDKWHIFWKNPGDLGEAPKVTWELPAGVTVGPLEWPRHEIYQSMGFSQNVYHDEVVLIAPLTLAKDLKPGELTVSAKVTWQECEVACVQGEANVSAAVRVGDELKLSAHAKGIDEWRAKVPVGGDFGQVDWSQLWGMLALAFAGGLILNLMPCVLPVIALKVMGFVKQREEEPAMVRRMGMLYGLGVIASFLAMAGVLLAVRAGAGGETWGMQMQNVWFLLFLTVLMLLVSLNLLGVFEITLGSTATAKAGELAGKEGSLGAFANGMLMVALATPCLAPMLGTAIGFALTQPAVVVLLMFTMVALGLALPYVVLSFKTDWMRFLPKPGDWMESFKNLMAFPMLGAVAWLAWLTAGKLDDAGGLRVGLLLVLVALAAWVFGEFIQRGSKRRWLAWLGAMAATASAAACLFVFQDKLDWKPWSHQAVQEARQAGHPVLVDFTADWCLTCKANKRTSIEVDSVREKLAETGAVMFKGDFTDKNSVMADFIKSHGRPGVPLVLVYPARSGAPQVLPELLTPAIVLEALAKAAADKPTDKPAVSDAKLAWSPWSAEAVAKAREAGQPVLVDITADWCQPCKVIEKTAINVPKVREKLAELNAATLQADFTDKDSVIKAELNRFRRPGPPLVLVYPPDNNADPIVMPAKFTAEELLSALEKAQ